MASRYMTGVGNLKKEKPSSGHVSVRNNNKVIRIGYREGSMTNTCI